MYVVDKNRNTTYPFDQRFIKLDAYKTLQMLYLPHCMYPIVHVTLKLVNC